MCDIDHFKQVNDTYGHQCGDEVLKKIVEIISELIRADSDWLARYGGEEFCIVLPETQLNNATALAERLRKYLAGQILRTQGHEISITASFGVTGFDASNANKNITPEALIQVADQYLYSAKKGGRNQVASGSFARGGAKDRPAVQK
jgi:diguanylate cyclase (GGDEF)-like protein